MKDKSAEKNLKKEIGTLEAKLDRELARMLGQARAVDETRTKLVEKRQELASLPDLEPAGALPG